MQPHPDMEETYNFKVENTDWSAMTTSGFPILSPTNGVALSTRIFSMFSVAKPRLNKPALPW